LGTYNCTGRGENGSGTLSQQLIMALFMHHRLANWKRSFIFKKYCSFKIVISTYLCIGSPACQIPKGTNYRRHKRWVGERILPQNDDH